MFTQDERAKGVADAQRALISASSWRRVQFCLSVSVCTLRSEVVALSPLIIKSAEF